MTVGIWVAVVVGKWTRYMTLVRLSMRSRAYCIAPEGGDVWPAPADCFGASHIAIRYIPAVVRGVGREDEERDDGERRVNL